MPDPASPPTSPQYVPYQAYKPKRHSRNFSGTSASGSRPSSAVISPAASPRPRVQPDDDKEPMPTLSLVGSYGHSPSPSPIGRYMDSRAGTPTIRVQKVDTQPPDHATPDSSTSLPTSTNGNQLATAADTTPRSSTAVEFPHSTPSPSSSVPPSPSTLSHPHSAPMQQLSPAPRKISTFKRLTPRPSAPSSPLAGAPRQIHTTHSRSVSAASLQAVGKASDPPQPLASPANGQASNGSKTSTPNVLTTSPRPVEKSLPMTPRTSTAPLEEIRRSQSQASSLSKSISQSSSPYPEVNRSLTSSPYQKPKSAPYRPGFQPKGVYRPLTDEFLAIRRLKRDGEGDTGRLKRIEREKLERRFEKLVNLHFPAPGSDAEKIQHLKSEAPDVKPLNRRASSFFDFESIRSRKFSDAGDLWRGVVSGSQDKSRDIRAAEQRITPWEDDGAVTKCPLCQASFHPLTCRKHHCRLCGRIICALPPKLPQRPLSCSLLFVVNSQTRQIEEVGEGVDYGVRRKKPGTRQEEEDKFLKGVRICRECRPVLARQQYLRQADEQPTFAKIYSILIALEQEIEEILPQFQELIVSLNHDEQPSKEALAVRRRIVDGFAQYERLAKQIRALPTPEGPGSSRDRVQAAILARATNFLQKNMFPLQFVPKSSTSKEKQQVGKHERDTIDRDSELAKSLQPLLEQEALLESFIEEAKAQRKFEDVKTLRLNLSEIRKEIEKVVNASDLTL